MSYRNKLANGKYDFCLIYPFLIYLCRYFTLVLNVFFYKKHEKNGMLYLLKRNLYWDLVEPSLVCTSIFIFSIFQPSYHAISIC